MQLAAPPSRSPSIRGRLGAAACLLLASSSTAAHAAEVSPKWQLDLSGLLYGEATRTNVVEPMARITRLFPNGQTISATLGIDAITGASPTGGIASTEIQTTTTPSGRVITTQVGIIPTSHFRDIRGSLDLNWTRPTGGWLVTSLGAHLSREKDYRSLGANGKVSLSFMHRLTTLTLGGGYNDDGILPVGGTRAPLTDGTVVVGTGVNAKNVSTALVGLSRVLTRRWMVAVDGSQTAERGYLTEPYKIVSVVDPETGDPLSQLTESRPSTRDRRDVMVSSVYHLDRDIFYSSYRYYWDDWGIRSHTLDLKYRRELEQAAYVEPHLRYYFQSRATFFRYSLVDEGSLPEFVSADYRLGALQTLTLGLTYSFHRREAPGVWRIRGEYMRQWGNGYPAEAIGKQRGIDLAPPISIGSLVFAYSLQF
jgi:hypothetical protein